LADIKFLATDIALAIPDFDDPNIDKDEALAGVLGMVLHLLQFFCSLILAEDDSPYPEVRSAVANTDDPDIPVSTIRAWVLGLIFAIILPVNYNLVLGRRPMLNQSAGSQPILLLSLSFGYRWRCKW